MSWVRSQSVRLIVAFAALVVVSAATEIASADRVVLVSPLDTTLVRQAHQRAVDDAMAADARRGTAAAVAERVASRSAYGNQTNSEAVALAHRVHANVIDRAPWRPLKPSAGMHLDRFVNAYTARVVPEVPGAPHVLSTSTAPIRPVEGGDKSVPVDLRLGLTSGGLYEPRNPAVPTMIAQRLGAGTTVGGTHRIRFTPTVTNPLVDGALEGSTVFFANAGRDTDYLVQPAPLGAEAYFQIRSASSPEVFRLALELPSGAELRRVDDGGVVVYTGGEAVALVTAPRAWDADGTPITTSMTVDGTELVLTLRHRTADVAYPLLLDPAVLQISRTWSWYRGDADTSGWAFQTPFANFGPYADATGLYSRNLTPSFFGDGWWGKWYFQAPGRTWIGDAWMSNIDHDRQGYGGTCFYTGLEDSVGNPNYSSYQEVCDNASSYVRGTVCCMTSSSRGSKLAFGEVFHGSANRTYWEKLGGVTIDLFDDDDPTVTVTVPNGWTNNRSAPITFQAQDAGSGVLNGYLYLPGASWSGRVDVGGTSCKRAYCASKSPAQPAQTTVSNLPDGINTLRAHAVDVAGHTPAETDLGAFVVKVDTKGPDVSLDGALWVERGSLLSTQQDRLVVSAVDGTQASPRSGVKSIDVTIDGKPLTDEQSRANTQACPSGNCTMDRAYTIRAEDWDPGDHTVVVLATDQLGNTTKQEWTVTIDPRSGALYHYTFRTEYLPDNSQVRTNVGNGNILVQADDRVLESRGLDVQLTRYYNDRSRNVVSAFGRGWQANVGPDIRLVPRTDGNVDFYGPSGYLVRFTRNGDGSYRLARGPDASLRQASDGNYSVVMLRRDETYTFSAAGRLLTYIDQDGAGLHYAYTSQGCLDTITDAEDRVTNFDCDTLGRVQTVTLPDGSVDSYGYTGDRLTSHTGPNGTTTYAYTTSGRLDRIDAPGESLKIVYGSDGRAQRVVDPYDPPTESGPATTYTWTGGLTVAHDADGDATYEPDPELLVRRSWTGATPPSLSVSGALRTADGTTVDPDGHYDVALSGAEQTAGARGLVLEVDRTEIESAEQASGTSMSADWTFDAAEYVDGEYLVTAVITDGDGDERTETWKINVGAATVDAAGPADPVPTEQEKTEKARRFRTTFGLDSSDAAIAAADSDPAAQESADVYGVPLTPAERAVIETGETVQNAVDAIDDYGEDSAPDAYAGVYTDHPGGGLVYVGFTRDQSSHLANLQATFAYPTKLRVFNADYTWAELEATHEAIANDVEVLAFEGIDVRQIRTNERTNRVEVGVANPGPTTEMTLRLRYGDSVNVVTPDDAFSFESRRSFHRRVKAGLYVEGLANGAPCTSNFSARSERTYGRHNAHRYFVMTAGHCGVRNEGFGWSHGGRGLGIQRINHYQTGSSADVLLIRTSQRRVSERIYTSPGHSLRVSSIQSIRNDEHRGDFVCASGVTTNRVECGEIKDRDVTVRYGDGVRLRRQRLASIHSCKGDSGAPIWENAAPGRAQAAGVLSGGVGGDGECASDTVYSQISRVQLQANVEVCVVGRCD